MYVYNCAASCGNGTPPPPVPVDEVEPHFLYFVNHSQQPPQIHKLLICHSKNLLCRPNISLVLSGIFQAAMNQGINLGFAECVTDLKDILDFLEEYYGPLSTWDEQAAKENGVLRNHRLAVRAFANNSPTIQVQTPKFKQPTQQQLLFEIENLAKLSPVKFNPALLPTGNVNYVEVNIGEHQPQQYKPNKFVYTDLTYCKHVIPASVATGMIRYGQDFLRLVAAVATLVSGNAWRKNHPNSRWTIGQISDFLLNTLNSNPAVASNKIATITKRVNNKKSRATIKSKRTPLTQLTVAELKQFLQSSR